MAQYVRAIKSRISNIEGIAKITNAMNAIAMTKVMRLKRRLAGVGPYVDDLEEFTRRLAGQRTSDAAPHPLMIDRGADRTAILVLNSDRGYCERYKGELNHAAESELEAVGPSARILAGGEKACAYFVRRGIEPLRSYANAYEPPTWEAAVRIANDVMQLYEQGEIGRVKVVYMRFASDLLQKLGVVDLLPVVVRAEPGEALVEPDLATALAEILPLFVRAKLYALMVETKTSEEAIRRRAMKSATDNAEELLGTLRRSYNRARQQSITREIADIIGGTEALRKT
ncbi:MAG: ATP synthase F1 subunit gamma [Candidatus Bipolaricaulis sp.]|nr:ATP synthase F1 subunit gamma [Candidatus Bipolaricaulis sp.]